MLRMKKLTLKMIKQIEEKQDLLMKKEKILQSWLIAVILIRLESLIKKGRIILGGHTGSKPEKGI